MSNHQRPDCLLIRLVRRKSKKTPQLHVTGLCEGNPPVTGGFPSYRASNAENVSIWWRHHVDASTPATAMLTYAIQYQMCPYNIRSTFSWDATVVLFTCRYGVTQHTLWSVKCGWSIWRQAISNQRSDICQSVSNKPIQGLFSWAQ